VATSKGEVRLIKKEKEKETMLPSYFILIQEYCFKEKYLHIIK
jgi:hypothetical protein